MNSIHWKKRNFSYLIAGLIICYLLFRLRTYNHDASVRLEKAKITDVWEYVADFSKMKDLNPTIINFNIIDEGGNYDHWKYSVEYSEHLSHWPYMENYAVGHYDVKALDGGAAYYVNSTHNTCMLGKLLCLKSESTFKFTKDRDAVLCEEFVQYQCPAILSQFCFREVDFQRNAIMKNLKIHFYKK